MNAEDRQPLVETDHEEIIDHLMTHPETLKKFKVNRIRQAKEDEEAG